MSFFNRIFLNTHNLSQQAPQSKEDVTVTFIAPTREYAQLMKFTQALNSLLMSDKFLARSDYRQLVEDYAQLNNFFQNQKAAKTLSYYCSANGVPGAEVEAFLRNYLDIANLESGSESICRHNQMFVERHLESEKDYLDNILKSVDPIISLDAEQRQVVLSDEDYTLVIAGAGAGKTTTIAAKVRYLVERQHIVPEKILVISSLGECRRCGFP